VSVGAAMVFTDIIIYDWERLKIFTSSQGSQSVLEAKMSQI